MHYPAGVCIDKRIIHCTDKDTANVRVYEDKDCENYNGTVDLETAFSDLYENNQSPYKYDITCCTGNSCQIMDEVVVGGCYVFYNDAGDLISMHLIDCDNLTQEIFDNTQCSGDPMETEHILNEQCYAIDTITC